MKLKICKICVTVYVLMCFTAASAYYKNISEKKPIFVQKEAKAFDAGAGSIDISTYAGVFLSVGASGAISMTISDLSITNTQGVSSSLTCSRGSSGSGLLTYTVYQNAGAYVGTCSSTGTVDCSASICSLPNIDNLTLDSAIDGTMQVICGGIEFYTNVAITYPSGPATCP